MHNIERCTLTSKRVKALFNDIRLNPILWMVSKPAKPIKFRIKYTESALMSFVTRWLRDKRDLSTSTTRLSIQRNRSLDLPFYWYTFMPFLKAWKIREDTIKGVLLPRGKKETRIAMVAYHYFMSLDTPLSRKMAQAAWMRDWYHIVNANIDPNDPTYNGDSDLFMRDYCAVKFLSKYSGFDLGENTKVNALKDWLWAEGRCFQTNLLLRNYRNKDLERSLFAVKGVIQKILGGSPSLTEVRENLRIGPGATKSCPSSYCSVLDKLRDSTTTQCQDFDVLNRVYAGSNLFEHLAPTLSSCTNLAFAPKKWNVDRPIEPPEDLDMPPQLALGSIIRKRLRRFGFDLDTQAARNGRLAEFGSLTNRIATIDLKAASGTICYNLVKLLLPEGWFRWLDRFRSRRVQISDPYGSDKTVTRKLHSFSAMGNGYTFELETLIFLAVALVACRVGGKRVPNFIGVFGDDICVPTMDADETVRILNSFGFTINTEKTYITGPFRESCGMDYFNGAPVRPYFQKEELTSAKELFVLANGIRRVSSRSLIGYGCDIRYRNVWNYAVGLIEEERRVFGPSDLGDEVIWSHPEDGVNGEWAIYKDSIWNYRTGPYVARQRGINLFYYVDSLTHAWSLISEGRISKNFYVRKTIIENEPMLTRDEPIASVLPRTYRVSVNSKYKLGFRLSSRTPLIRTDCTPFI